MSQADIVSASCTTDARGFANSIATMVRRPASCAPSRR
jgi:hypothetical protein